MPATLDATRRIFDRLQRQGLCPVTLLVVPDSGWDAATLDRLRELLEAGAQLAGHGWRHRIFQIRNLRHRLHSLLISRDVAEHLALDRAGAAELVRRCHAWFGAHDLPSPDLYVPPAWAMGELARADLDALPFTCYETLRGVYFSSHQQFLAIPMVGYEADTALRAAACRCWNALNSRVTSRPLRVGIHPADFELRLADDLRRFLGRGGQPLGYGQLPAFMSAGR